MSSRKPHKFTAAGGRSVVIWGSTSKLDALLNDVNPTSATDKPLGSTDVAPHSRKRYPGATAIQVAGHDRITDPNRGFNGAVLPGKLFWLETGAGLTLQTRQFNYTGLLADLKAVVDAKAKGQVTLRASSGEAWTYGS